MWRQRRALIRIPKGVGGAGRYQTARLVLVATAAAQLHVLGELSALEVLALVLAILALAAETLLRSLNRIAVPYAANIPGHVSRDRPSIPCGWLFPLNLLCLFVLVQAVLAPSVLTPLVFVLAVAVVGRAHV